MSSAGRLPCVSELRGDEERAEDAFVVETRTAIHPHGPGYGDAPLVRSGAHCERHPRKSEDSHQSQEGEVWDERNYAMGQKTPPSAAFFRLFDEEDAELGCGHPVMVSRWTGSSEAPCSRSSITRSSLCRSLTVRCR